MLYKAIASLMIIYPAITLSEELSDADASAISGEGESLAFSRESYRSSQAAAAGIAKFEAWKARCKVDAFQEPPPGLAAGEAYGRFEMVELDVIRVIGTISKPSGPWDALIQTCDGSVHRVKVGERLGRLRGTVVAVSDEGITVVESIPVCGTSLVGERTVIVPMDDPTWNYMRIPYRKEGGKNVCLSIR